MIKYFFFLLITLMSLEAFSEDTIVLNSVETRVFHEENVLDFIVGAPGIIDVKKVGGDFIISPIAIEARSYIVFLKKDGTSKSYIIDIQSTRHKGDPSNRSQMISGILTGRTSFSDVPDKSGTPYSLGLNTEIRTTENTRAIFSLESYDDLNKQSTELTLAQLYYKDNYILWSRFGEPSASIPYYIGSNFRGYTLGQRSSNTDFGVWTANKYENREEIEGSRAQGAFIYNSFFDFPYRIALSNYEDRYIPTASVTVKALGITHNLGFSFLDDKYLYRYSAVKSFNQNHDEFTLRTINGYLSGAPNGSYGLYNQNNNFQQDYGSAIIFSNKDEVIIDADKEKDIDFIPGAFSATVGYDHSTFQKTLTDRYHGFVGYGNLQKITLSGTVDYGQTSNYGLVSQTISYSPRLSLFIVGDKRDGISLRNEYSSTVEKNIVGQLNQSTRNIVGIYKNTRKYYVGVYGGANQFESPNAEVNSKVIGADYAYNFQDATAIRLNIENDSTDSGSYQNKIGLQAGTTYKKDLSLIAKVSYLENHSASGPAQSSAIGFLGLIWRFGAGTGNVYSSISEGMRTVSGHVYNDENFNGVKDSNEEYLAGVTVSSIKMGDNTQVTDSSGYYKFSGFSNTELASLSIKDEKYSLVKDATFPMSKSREEDLGVYSGYTKKVFAQDAKGNPFPLSSLAFSCETEGKRLKKEIYSEYSLVYFPKNVKCEIGVDATQESSALIDKVEEKGDEIHVVANILPKMLAFEFDTKIQRPIKINNKLISPKNGQIIEMIEHFDGIMRIDLGQKCYSNPVIEDFSYNKLKNQNIFKISCF